MISSLLAVANESVCFEWICILLSLVAVDYIVWIEDQYHKQGYCMAGYSANFNKVSDCTCKISVYLFLFFCTFALNTGTLIAQLIS